MVGSSTAAAPASVSADDRNVVASSDHLYSKRARAAGHVWTAITVPIAAVTGLLISTPRAYLVAFVLIGALNVCPALALSLLACRRVAPVDRRFWRLFSTGLACIAAIGLLILMEAITGLLTSHPWVMLPGLALLTTCVVAFFGSLFELVRTRSTIRFNILDVLESAMIVIAVGAFAPLLWGSHPIVTDTFWFTVPMSVATIAVLAGFCMSIAMFRRVRGQTMPDETLGLLIGFVCSLNTLMQTAQRSSSCNTNVATSNGISSAIAIVSNDRVCVCSSSGNVS